MGDVLVKNLNLCILFLYGILGISASAQMMPQGGMGGGFQQGGMQGGFQQGGMQGGFQMGGMQMGSETNLIDEIAYTSNGMTLIGSY